MCVLSRYDVFDISSDTRPENSSAQCPSLYIYFVVCSIRFFFVDVFNCFLVSFWPACEWLVPVGMYRSRMFRRFVKCKWHDGVERRQKCNNNNEYRSGRQLERRLARTTVDAHGTVFVVSVWVGWEKKVNRNN